MVIYLNVCFIGTNEKSVRLHMLTGDVAKYFFGFIKNYLLERSKNFQNLALGSINYLKKDRKENTVRCDPNGSLGPCFLHCS